MAVDLNKDYQAEINAEKAKGANADPYLLAGLEAARNQKIDAQNAAGTNLKGYEKTSNYSIPNSGSAPTVTAMSMQDQYLNDMYAQQEALAKSKLEQAYNKNVATLNATAAKIPETYNTARNQTAAMSEQNRAAFNEIAAARGINSGAGSQANLAMSNVLTGNIGALNKQEADAITNINTQRAQLEIDYKNRIAQAQAEGNLAKAQALYQEAIRQDNLLLEQQQNQQNFDFQKQQYNNSLVANNAEALASIGDFSGFKLPPYNWTDAQVQAAQSLFQQKNAPKTTYSGGGGTKQKEVDDTPTAPNGNAIDFNSPYGIIYDIDQSRQQGYTNEQLKANAKALYDSGQLTPTQYQMYLQYIGR